MPKKFYAVHRGAARGVYTDWNIVKELVHGIPGSNYCSFTTEEAAEYYVQHGEKPDAEELAEFSGKFHDIKGPKMQHIVIHAEPNQVIFWDRLPGGHTDGVKFIKKLSTETKSKESNFQLWAAELKGVAEQLEEWISGVNGVLPIQTKELQIDVTETHAYNILTRYLPLWKSNDYKTYQGKTVAHVDLMKLIAEQLENTSLPCKVTFGFHRKPIKAAAKLRTL